MSEEAKYYTPDISEFHVGLEFELYEHTHDEPMGGWQSPSIFGNLLINNSGGMYSTDLKEVEKWILDEEVRVKHLDREDIESLGFIKREKSEWIGWTDYILAHISGDTAYFLKATIHEPKMDDLYKIYLHRYLDIDSKIEMCLNEGESELVYKGKIKNKSELKKLLKQLGI